jgi:hypothetical protein
MHALAGLEAMADIEPSDAHEPFEFRFPAWVRVLAPSAVLLVYGAILGWALWGRGLGWVTWIAVASVLTLAALEAHKRSMAIVVTHDELIERDLLGQRVLSLAQLERARLFRNARLWFYFRGEPKPVWVIKGMGDPSEILRLVLARAQALGSSPEVQVVSKP